MSPLNCLVTGAAGGIGRAVVAALRVQGHTVHTWDLPEVDVTDAAEITGRLDRLEEESGALDAVVHAAGIMRGDSALRPQEEALRESLEVNFLGAVNVCAPMAQRMVSRGRGSIVVVSSNAAAVPRAGMAAYGASKAALTSWVRTLGLECAPSGVRCNIVSPGSTNTAMLRGLWPEGQDRRAAVIVGDAEAYRLGIPLQRVADPADIAAACLFLLSDQARHITLHDLRVDGGATLDA